MPVPFRSRFSPSLFRSAFNITVKNIIICSVDVIWRFLILKGNTRNE